MSSETAMVDGDRTPNQSRVNDPTPVRNIGRPAVWPRFAQLCGPMTMV